MRDWLFAVLCENPFFCIKGANLRGEKAKWEGGEGREGENRSKERERMGKNGKEREDDIAERGVG